jgi:hypothetical protein
MRSNSSLVVASSTILPAYITTTRSVRPAITPMSWVMRMTPCAAAPQVVDEVEDLRLDGDVEGGRGLVGDEQLRARTPAPWRSSPAGGDRRRARGDTGRAARPAGASPPGSGPRGPAPRLRLGHVAVQADPLGDLLADRHGRVERRHRVLGDQGHLVPPDLRISFSSSVARSRPEQVTCRRSDGRCWGAAA